MPKPRLHLDATVAAFVRAHPDRSACRALTAGQHVRYQFLVAGGAAFLAYDYKVFTAALLFGVAAFYALVIGYKLLCFLLSVLFRPEIRVWPRDLEALRDEELPVYTVLIPLYKEPEVAATVVRAMEGLDYPGEKLDIKLLLEEDDAPTVRAVEAMDLPACVEAVIVPHALPKTKPKACNHGLARARGSFLVIYDAEDRPDPDQLRKAVAAFARMPENVACLQAKLNYYNPYQNLLTRWFALEYTAWYDLFLPGLHCLRVPIPLGGTSNHFRTGVLRHLGGWDPFNLTEDCDLGIRLHREGWRTLILDSTTWEEANSRLGNWIRQRSRWVKGYIQTHLVHARSNLATLWDLGPLGYLSFLLTVGGLSLTLLLNPFFWAMLLAYAGLWAGHEAGWTPPPWQLRYSDRVADLPGASLTLWSRLSWVFWYVALVLFGANAVFVLINLFACARRRLWRLIPEALLSPVYWILISVAGWKGFLQLFTRPFYWEKTLHGLGDGAARAGAESPETEDADAGGGVA